MTSPSKTAGKSIIDKLAAGKDAASLLDEVRNEANNIKGDIVEKNLSDNEIITRLSCFKSVSSLRSGSNMSIEQVLNESDQVLKWVKSQ